MNILCNLPVECFEDRSRFAQRIVTYGPDDRMMVDGVHYPFDVSFDPSTGSIEELLARLPADFMPDVLLLYWPDQEPLPAGLERAPLRVVGVISDYNLTLPFVAGLWPFFDVLLVDTPGVPLFERLSFGAVRPFCQYTFKAPTHRLYPDERRDIDIAFAGNLDPIVQRERAPWIERLLRLRERGVRVEVRSGVFGEAYGRLLNRAHIGFNHSIRGEMNLRAFEVPACGALLMMERDNQEVRDFLVPDEEVVLYGEDFEQIVLDLLADPDRLQHIARRGHERIQSHSMSARFHELESLLSVPDPGRPPADAHACALARGVAMLPTWASAMAPLRPLLEAADRDPDDPRPLNAMALALIRAGNEHVPRAVELLRRACAISDTYVPAALNLACLLEAVGETRHALRFRDSVGGRLAAVSDFEDLDGPLWPVGFGERALRISAALRDTVLAGDPRARLEAWAAPVG